MLTPPSPDITTLSADVLFDISTDNPTVLITNTSVGSGLANVSWWFELYSPNNNPIHTGSESQPDITGTWTTYTISDNWGYIEWSGAPYLLTMFAKDSDGNIYSVDYNAVICRPAGNKKASTNRYGKASVIVSLKCNQGSIYFQNQTSSSYKGKEGEFVSSVLKVVYPADDSGVISTPFSTINFTTAMVPITVSSDNYEFISYQVYDYPQTDNVTIRIKYYQRERFPVWCNINLFPLICEYNRLIDSVESGNCSDAADANRKLQLINSKLALVLIGLQQPMTGVDVPKLIKEIEEIGDFDCDCCSFANSAAGVQPATGHVIDGYNFTVTNSGGDVVGSFADSVGNNIVLTLHDRSYVFNIGQSTLDQTDAFSVSPTSTSTSKTYSLNVDLAEFAADTATTIQASPTLIDAWNAALGLGGETKIIVDGGCIFESTLACDYTFTLENIPASTTYAILTSVKVGSIVKNVNYSFNGASLSGLQSKLNSLDIGTWTVADAGGGVVELTSSANPNQITDISYKVTGILTSANMERECTGYTEITLDEFAANIVNYLCSLNDSQVKTSQDYVVSWLDASGVQYTTTVSSDSALSTLLSQIVSGFGQTIQYISSLGAVNCQTIKQQFQSNTSLDIGIGDFILGTKNGQCSRISFLDVFNYMLTAGYTDLTTVSNFCDLVTKCGSGNICQPFSYLDVVVTDYDTFCTQAVGIGYTLS